MATFTMTLEEALEYDHGKIGLDDYPIFDEDYRPTLNQKIIDHYWNQEIGMETVSMFRLAMKRRMNEIMPLYNEHYKLSKLKVDPLSTVSIKSITNITGESNGTAESNTVADGVTNSETVSDGSSENSSLSDAKSRAVASDTPQNALSENGDYATSMQDSVSDSRASGQATENNRTTGEGSERSTTTGNESRGERTEQASENSTDGYSGHAPELIFAARQALVNVDLMIINELRDLFMLIWSNNDTFTNSNRLGYFGYGY